MDELVYGYFPRIHTAIAEWMACMAFILPVASGQKNRAGFAAPILLGTLLVTFLLMEYRNIQGVGWIVLMILANGQMFLALVIGGNNTWANALFYWAHAFMLAEFAAALEWQINTYLLKAGVFHSMGYTYLVMSLVYLPLFAGIWFRRRHWRGVQASRVSWHEAFSAVGIAVGAFIISNVQFIPDGALFAKTMSSVNDARTLVCLSGVVMLYASNEQRREMLLRYELNAMQRIFHQQYEQYEQFVANNEAMHRVYHDLKHQIAYLEGEVNREKRLESLKEMKEIIRTHESHVNTGNRVLDVLLTGKSLVCAKENILLTCYADAKLLDFMDAMDICSIFGNTIDNAIEYERTVPDQEERLIKVHVGARGAFLVIRIQNFCKEPLDLTGDIPATTKPDKQFHGFGLRSVRYCAEKHGGHLDITQEDGWFTVTVLIPLPQTQ